MRCSRKRPLIAAVLSLSVQTGSVSLVTMLVTLGGRGRGAAGGGIIHRAAGGELSRALRRSQYASGVDDDSRSHGSRSQRSTLAAILHGASIKLLLFPASRPSGAADGRIVAVGGRRRFGRGRAGGDGRCGLVESLLARLAFRRVPLLLTTAFLLCLFALLVAWKGGAK